MELSRQLADFLAKPLQQSGGIMTLPDVYCLYNRARGTELVSPDDLLQAIKMFDQVRIAYISSPPCCRPFEPTPSSMQCARSLPAACFAVAGPASEAAQSAQRPPGGAELGAFRRRGVRTHS